MLVIFHLPASHFFFYHEAPSPLLLQATQTLAGWVSAASRFFPAGRSSSPAVRFTGESLASSLLVLGFLWSGGTNPNSVSLLPPADSFPPADPFRRRFVSSARRLAPSLFLLGFRWSSSCSHVSVFPFLCRLEKKRRRGQHILLCFPISFF